MERDIATQRVSTCQFANNEAEHIITPISHTLLAGNRTLFGPKRLLCTISGNPLKSMRANVFYYGCGIVDLCAEWLPNTSIDNFALEDSFA